MGGGLTDALARAEEAAALVGQDPARAYRLASEAAVAARAVRDWEAAAVALRAAARAASWQGQHDEASVRIRRAVEAARRARTPGRLVEAQTTAAWLWFLRGARSRAMASLDEAAALATGDLQLTVAAQRAVLLWRTGLHDEAGTLLRDLAREASGELRADALVNLGGVLAEQGRFAEAEAVLVEAARGYEALGLHHDAAAVALHNLALAYADSGRIPDSLRTFAEVEQRLVGLGAPVTWLLVGQAQVLLAANLVDEALDVAERAVASLDRRAPVDERAEAWARLAAARLRAGQAVEAGEAARTAARWYARVGNTSRATLAGALRVRALAASGAPNRRLLASAQAAAEALGHAGFGADALEVWLEAVRLGGLLGRADVVAALGAAPPQDRRRGPVLLRARAWYGEALVRATLGDEGRATRALERGLRLLDEHRASLGSTELRAQAAGHGADLADLGVHLALARGRPAQVLRWAERWRAAVVRRRPMPTPELEVELALLRRVRAERTEAAAAGNDVDALLRREQRLEAGIRQLSRRTAGGEEAGPGDLDRLESGRLHAALGERALVEVVEDAGHLHAVVAAGGRCTLHRLGDAASVQAELAALGFSLRRLGRPRSTAAAAEGARASAEHALTSLDELLVGPLRRRLVGREVVVVPTAALHAVPWPSLPSLGSARVTVVPSSTWWAQGSGATPGSAATTAVALVAGPGLPGAQAEVAELAERYPGAEVLAGQAATTEATAKALGGAALAHLACHGRFRLDDPLLSCLELADGALTVYDLERLQHAPELVVLSACDSGVSATRPGNELLGLLASLVALGTSAVVASVVPVPDLDTRVLMLALHDALRAGTAPAAALEQARAAVDPASPTGFVTRTAFVCFGRG